MWVSAKLGEGDFKGAVRLANSESTLALFNEATFEALKERHPDPHPESIIAPIKESQGHHAICVTKEEVAKAIRSFPKSSAGSPDGLRPQHLKDMLLEKGSQDILLPALTSFVQLVLEGRSPATVQPFFFGANLQYQLKVGTHKIVCYTQILCVYSCVYLHINTFISV